MGDENRDHDCHRIDLIPAVAIGATSIIIGHRWPEASDPAYPR